MWADCARRSNQWCNHWSDQWGNPWCRANQTCYQQLGIPPLALMQPRERRSSRLPAAISACAPSWPFSPPTLWPNGALHSLPVVADEDNFRTSAELAQTGPIRLEIRVANDE